MKLAKVPIQADPSHQAFKAMREREHSQNTKNHEFLLAIDGAASDLLFMLS
jgi:hypothetical protein